MIDRTTKLILAFLAAGLWANALVPAFKSTPARADTYSYLSSIDSNIGKIAHGSCSNAKLC
jgi:hypothetical protein